MYRYVLIPCVLCLALICLAPSSGVEVEALRYVDAYKHLAIAEMDRHGIPASVTLAQALVESDAGRSTLAQRANNHFGIKCKSWWEGGKYYYADDDRDEDGNLTASCFRIYASVKESFEDRSAFLIGSERYQILFGYASDDYRSWAHGLQSCGYATDPKYGARLVAMIERYGLHQFDAASLSETPGAGH